jgi:hypothetical protein
MLRVSLFGDAYKKAQIDDGSIATLLKDELRNFLVVRDRPGWKSHFCLGKIQQRIRLIIVEVLDDKLGYSLACLA